MVALTPGVDPQLWLFVALECLVKIRPSACRAACHESGDFVAKLTQQDLESRLWGAANALRGPVDPADFRTYAYVAENY